MTRVAFLRHAPTTWNQEGRLQGRADLPLAPESQSDLAGRRVPAALDGAQWHVSPLTRARQTATLLGHGEAAVEPALIEIDYGEFEGARLAELRARLGPEMTANEARGLDFRPPGGESPREVRRRVAAWLARLAAVGGHHVAVTHKTVIRSVLSLALDWDMVRKQPVRLNWRRLHLFTLDADGRPVPFRLDLPLERR